LAIERVLTPAGTHPIDIRRELPDAYRALAALTRAGRLDHRLAELVKLRVSQINGCAHCVDLHAGLARKAGEPEPRLAALPVWRESALFSPRERAALRLAESLTLLADGPVPEDAYRQAQEHFPGNELAHLVVVITAINAWNRVLLASGARAPAPGG
jgi:AhpD family alkylhydroperoxidase